MMETEVTQEFYQNLMGSNPSEYQNPKHPVETVSWIDAATFANKLSQSEGLSPCYSISGTTVTWSNHSCKGWRLPTEAEWEYAARAYSGTVYAGGNAATVALYYKNSNEDTEPVTQRAPNKFGLYGMSGNVAEWVWDGLGTYPSADQTDPVVNGDHRVRRGGGLNSNVRFLRVSARDSAYPTTRAEDVGFRLVRFP